MKNKLLLFVGYCWFSSIYMFVLACFFLFKNQTTSEQNKVRCFFGLARLLDRFYSGKLCLKFHFFDYLMLCFFGFLVLRCFVGFIRF